MSTQNKELLLSNNMNNNWKGDNMLKTEKKTHATINEWIDLIAKKTKEGESVNIVRVSEMILVYQMLKEMAEETEDSLVFYEVNEPYRGMGYIGIVTKDMHIRNTKLFLECIRHADNFEVYPRQISTIQINLGFYGLIKK